MIQVIMTPITVHHITPTGYAALKKELDWLLRDERPKIVDIVSWAAGNGDRSENGDYIYNKKELRKIDRRIRYLTKKLENSKIVDPREQQNLDRVFFGATVRYAREDGREVGVTLVGVDEADLAHGKINWLSPVGKALLKSQKGDVVKVRTRSGTEKIKVLQISYLLEDDDLSD